MLTQIAQRSEWIDFVGMPLHVRATLSQIGQIPGRDDRRQVSTLLLHHITLDGVDSDIDHTWIRIGPTARSRLDRLPQQGRGCTVEMTAEITPYRGGPHGSEWRLGLGEVRDLVLHLPNGKVRTLARNKEAVDTEIGNRYTASSVDCLMDDMLYLRQLPAMEQYRERAQHRRTDKATRAALDRFFLRGEPVTAGQLRHLAHALEAL